MSEPGDVPAQLANQFERRRAERINQLSSMDYSDVDDILVDIANLCMMYYINKNMIPEGFVPFGSKE